MILALFLRASNVSDIQSVLVMSLQQDLFLLGDRAKDVTVLALLRWAESFDTSTRRDNNRLFLEEIWRLHRAEDTDALPASDAVARFIKMYA